MKTTTNSAARALRVLKALKGHSLHGIRNADLATLTDESPAFITRAMDTLIAEGLAERMDSGRFRLGIMVAAIAHAHTHEMKEAAALINELDHRVNAGARQINQK